MIGNKMKRTGKLLILIILNVITIFGIYISLTNNIETVPYKKREETESKQDSDMEITYKDETISLEIKNGDKTGIYECKQIEE